MMKILILIMINQYWRLSNYLLYEGKYFGLHWDVTRMPIYPIFLSLVRLVSDSVNFVIIIQKYFIYFCFDYFL